jgi:hypothetical protein
VNYADVAGLGYITGARATQAMNLLHLAPDIEDELLFTESTTAAHAISEHDLREIAGLVWTATAWVLASALAVVRRNGRARSSLFHCRENSMVT